MQDGARHGKLDAMGEGGSRQISVRRARWERWSGPVECWFRNRWNWRRARRLRGDIQRWKTLVIPLEQLAAHDDPDVQRMAVMAESLGYSGVLHYGYGMGEALLEAYRRQPQQLRPFIDRACGFTLEQLRGTPDLPGMTDAARARNQLLLTVREIVAAHPKELRAGS
jgi:hypothetical protein